MLQVSKELSVSQIDNESVVLDAVSGKYFGLNPTARRIFEVLQSTGSEELTIKTLVTEFAVEEDRLRKDVTAFAELLVAKGLARRV